MRFIHTADWHLGRLFHGVRLTDDQSHVIDQFIDLVAQVRPAAVLVAGDIYDRGVPPIEAVELLDDTLQRIVRGLGVPVVAIAGNHDSAARLGFGSRLLADQGLHIA
jgi:exonuclease SbcD